MGMEQVAEGAWLPQAVPAAPHWPDAGFDAEAIARHPRFAGCLRKQATTLVSIHAVNPRISSVFATQQRWLIAHLALAQYFRGTGAGEASGLHVTQFLDAVEAHGIASRNTADAFLKEMRHYGYLAHATGGLDRRLRPLEPTAISREMICAWLATHLTTLDGLDDGQRCAGFLAQPQAIAAIQPRIADALLRSRAIREPGTTFSLFTWLNEGGIVMDWLYAGLAEVAPGCERIPTHVASIADLGSRIRLSRTHLTRKLRLAETLGSLGWLGKRGKSTLWVSAGFVAEYHVQQSVKLAIIDAAFHAVLGPRGH